MKKVILLVILVLVLVGCEKTNVTESEWNKAFSLDSFSNCTLIITSGEIGEADCERITIKVEDSKFYYLGEEIYKDGNDFEMDYLYYYYTDFDGASWEYYEDSKTNEWKKSLSDNYALETIKGLSSKYKNLYYMYEYDEENKVYVKVEENTINSISFVGDKVSKIKIVTTSEEYTYTVMIEIKDYDKTKVELPKVNYS